MDLKEAREALEGKQADALEALASVDVAGLVKALEADAKRGTMEPGQRKTAHLLLSYYAPKADSKQATTDAESAMSKAQIIALLGMIRQAQASQANQNNGQVIEGEKASGANSLPRVANQPPSLGKSDSSAGVPERDEVLSDTPREGSSLQANPRESGSLESTAGDSSNSSQESSFDALMNGRPLL